ncbi:uncharacterized protein Nmag_0836 [Natrialba magadii ATCC 43099]|uniref:Uncharacterized protein n=1 Tax=Natrialba magadii (strain ATCC 43099 / DSM 3394 / CCM 3739 / CIP 104546 / IAM 13178 / JCM 8861 / NBRC 102185 / NCIMB 2190 / MS3) TaxID=547559 RepID=D3T062_NATMM|nr:hypothetical protein [Natrialba magadii]ADD04420.1 uncharacterized protein Nmag_0836 [Natrialba magadii ATCC 43099]ELY25816.1 hypothetical protein C500_16699 [Natrialba magadii ATCC 43099]
MQLEQSPQEAAWSGTVPSALDARVLGLIVVIAGLAASVNVPYGGVPLAVAAFVLLAGAGIVVHVLGERKLRRITDGLVDRWIEAGGAIEDVTKSSDGMRTEWTVHTPDGTITIGGIALVPLSRLSVEWQGVGDSMDASEAADNMDQLAATLYEEIFEIGSATQRS